LDTSTFFLVSHVIWLSTQSFQEHLGGSSKKKSLSAKTRVAPEM
jgi:hypothetical protein